MSTSDASALALDGERPEKKAMGFSGPDTPHAGLPDPTVLASIANELFRALPNSLELPIESLPGKSLLEQQSTVTPPTTVPAFQHEAQMPSDKHLPTLPASVGPGQAAPISVSWPGAPPAIPGVVGTTLSEVLAEIPPFSFLQEARPIFSDGRPSSGANSQAAPISEFASRASNPPQAGSALSQQRRLPEAERSTQVPSSDPRALATKNGLSSIQRLSFLEELRPLFSDRPSISDLPPGVLSAGLAGDAPFELDLADDFGRSPELTEISDRGPLGFFEVVRPLEPAEPIIRFEPLGIEPDVPHDLDLSAYPFDAESVKRDFPILRERVNGRLLVWLDNAATTQKPQSVIDRLKYFYEHENSNVHRAAHELAARATDAYESAREKVRRFLNASSAREIIFLRGATEGINLIAQSWGRRNIRKDDEIVITWLEHHANIVPWQMLCSETGAKLRVAPVDDSGQILLDEYEKLLGPRTRLVSITQVSNALGVVTPAAKMIEIAHRYGAKVLLDGAQSVSHMRVDVQSIDCDFFVFSGHKVFGPTGIGVVYGKPDVLETMPPWQGGGNMIQDVTFEKALYQQPPQRFEAGTGNIADAVGLGAALDYLDRIGMPNISRHEHELLVQATCELVRVPGLHIIGTATEKAGVLSFVLDGFKTEEVGAYLNKNGIAVRSGHHCAQPILRRFGYESTVRASLALYNTHEDIDRLVAAIWNLRLGHTSIA